jgi:hypothetical protein
MHTPYDGNGRQAFDERLQTITKQTTLLGEASKLRQKQLHGHCADADGRQLDEELQRLLGSAAEKPKH